MPPPSPSHMPAFVSEGDIVAGKYKVESVLGQGGMGLVVAARHIQLNQRVALKLLLPNVCENPQAVERFLREARAAVLIEGEHVARVLDVGALETGQAFMVMEFLRGVDLAAHLEATGPLPIAEAVDYILQACEAIAEAHVRGIVHRDIKPSNLFLTRRADGSPLVKVLDFGIAKAAFGELAVFTGGHQTSSSVVLGSPAYMAPEQMRNAANADPRADIWALGIVLTELLTGKTPFADGSFAGFCLRVATEPAPSIREKRPDVPAELDAVVKRCLEKAPDQRFVDLADLAEALAPFAPRASRVSVQRIVGTLQGTAKTLSESDAPRISSTAPAVKSPTTGGWGGTGPTNAEGRGWRRKIVAGGVAFGGLLVAAALWRATQREPMTNGGAPPILPRPTAVAEPAAVATQPEAPPVQATVAIGTAQATPSAAPRVVVTPPRKKESAAPPRSKDPAIASPSASASAAPPPAQPPRNPLEMKPL